MPALPCIKRQCSCLAVLPDMHAAGLACLDLHLETASNLAVSMLSRSAVDSDCGDLVRLKSVGTVSCRGAVSRTLRQQSVVRGDKLLEMTGLLELIGVPARHEAIYDRALKTGRVVLVLQGEADLLRQACQILEEISMTKPVLYLV